MMRCSILVLVFASALQLSSSAPSPCPDGEDCERLPCDIENSNGMPGKACACKGGFEGNITWSGGKASGFCQSILCKDPPSVEERASERYQCDRQCRWHSDGGSESVAGPHFFDRRIIGKMVRPKFMTKACCCYNQISGSDGSDVDVVPLEGGAPVVPFKSLKTFQTDSTWSGMASSNVAYGCNHVCVKGPSGDLFTIDKATAQAEGITPLHCGQCAMCSDMPDIEVLAGTRNWITIAIIKVTSKYGVPWGYGFRDISRLQKDLYDIPFNVSRTPRSPHLPSCMDCWTDNIMCDISNCMFKCWKGVFDAKPTRECLQCDETHCGPEFIKCAGANRRSTGIVSDIQRDAKQICKAGFYSNVSAEAMPLYAQPHSLHGHHEGEDIPFELAHRWAFLRRK